MSDKAREAFEKWYLTTQPRARELKALDVTPKGDYLWDGVNGKWIAWQAAYNLREKEVRRLRQLLIIVVGKVANITISQRLTSFGVAEGNRKKLEIISNIDIALQETTKG